MLTPCPHGCDIILLQIMQLHKSSCFLLAILSIRTSVGVSSVGVDCRWKQLVTGYNRLYCFSSPCNCSCFRSTWHMEIFSLICAHLTYILVFFVLFRASQSAFTLHIGYCQFVICLLFCPCTLYPLVYFLTLLYICTVCKIKIYLSLFFVFSSYFRYLSFIVHFHFLTSSLRVSFISILLFRLFD